MTGGVQLGCPEDVHRALRVRADALQLPRQVIDRLAGLTSGYSSKLLAPQPGRRMSMESMFSLIAALGCDLVLQENEKSTAQITAGNPKRRLLMPMHATTVHVMFSKRELRRRQHLGGDNSRKYMPKKKATALARKAARARWKIGRN